MKSDFFGARVNLEYAERYLCGADETTLKIREAVDLLIEAVITAEFHQRPANVIQFPRVIKRQGPVGAQWRPDDHRRPRDVEEEA